MERIYLGVNIEPAVMNLGLCAERTALFSALAQGEREFETIAVYVGTKKPGQVFSDLAPDIVWILVGDEEIKVETLDDMLPNRFILNKFRDWRNE